MLRPVSKAFLTFCPLLTLLCIQVVPLSAQSSLSLNFEYLSINPNGGFEYSEPFKSRHGRISLGYSWRDSSLLGFSAHLASGIRELTFSYPVFYLCEDANGPFVCVDPTVAPQGFYFRYTELYAGATLFGGRIVQFSVGPYVSFNSNKSGDSDFEIDPDYYYPYTLNELYKRVEFGGQAHLSLMLPLGKHFFIKGNGMIANTLSDLRKDEWKDAKSVLVFGNNEYVEMKSSKLSARYYAFGLGVGFTW